jgi:hypothetical protein
MASPSYCLNDGSRLSGCRTLGSGRVVGNSAITLCLTASVNRRREPAHQRASAGMPVGYRALRVALISQIHRCDHPTNPNDAVSPATLAAPRASPQRACPRLRGRPAGGLRTPRKLVPSPEASQLRRSSRLMSAVTNVRFDFRYTFTIANIQSGMRSTPGTGLAKNDGGISQCHPSRVSSAAPTPTSRMSSAGDAAPATMARIIATWKHVRWEIAIASSVTAV